MVKKSTKYSVPGAIIALLIAGASYFLNDNTSSENINSTPTSNIQRVESKVKQEPLAFDRELQLVLGPLDDLGRATDAHIQLKDAFEPTEERESLTYNPPGYKQTYMKNTMENGKTYEDPLWSRGHLVGYQFSGLNNEPKNLVPQTIWSNAGAYYNTDSSNTDAMLYYEERLDDWLYENKSYYLDFQVTPLYEGNELVPRQIRLAYVGYDSNGKQIPISVGGKEQKGNGGATVVIIDNVSPNADIDYATGAAEQKK